MHRNACIPCSVSSVFCANGLYTLTSSASRYCGECCDSSQKAAPHDRFLLPLFFPRRCLSHAQKAPTKSSTHKTHCCSFLVYFEASTSNHFKWQSHCQRASARISSSQWRAETLDLRYVEFLVLASPVEGAPQHARTATDDCKNTDQRPYKNETYSWSSTSKIMAGRQSACPGRIERELPDI